MPLSALTPRLALAACCAACVLLPATVEAGGAHHKGKHGRYYWGPSVGVWVGPPVVVGVPAPYPYYPYYPYYRRYPYAYPYPYYYDDYYVRPPIARPYGYREGLAPAPLAPPAANWYYCPSAREYYPHIQSCFEGWQAVPAQPAGGNR